MPFMMKWNEKSQTWTLTFLLIFIVYHIEIFKRNIFEVFFNECHGKIFLNIFREKLVVKFLHVALYFDMEGVFFSTLPFIQWIAGIGLFKRCYVEDCFHFLASYIDNLLCNSHYNLQPLCNLAVNFRLSRTSLLRFIHYLLEMIVQSFEEDCHVCRW